MSLFIAEKGPGFTVARKLEKLGYKGIDTCELVFEDYRVPADRLIGGVEGQGLQQVLVGPRARPHQRRRARRRRRAGGARGGRGLCAGAQDLRQADLRAPGDPAQARRHGDARRGRAAAGRVAPRDAYDRGERCDMEAGMAKLLRHRGRRWRTRSRRCASTAATATPRNSTSSGYYRDAPLLRHRRRHQRDAAHHHRQAADRAESAHERCRSTGVRIIAVEQYGAGPFGTQHLADLGAEVIKIENPADGGDVGRAVGPHFFGAAATATSSRPSTATRGASRSTSSTPGGQRVLARARAERRRGVRQPARRPAGEARPHLRAADATSTRSIVCAHLSAYGRSGSRAAWPGYDYLMQAEAGYLSLTGEPDGPPARFGLSIVDMMTGIDGRARRCSPASSTRAPPARAATST